MYLKKSKHLSYLEFGVNALDGSKTAEKPLVLFLHAYGMHPARYAILLSKLGETFHILAPLTCGLSEFGKFDFQANLRALSQFQNEFGMTIVVGHSCGGLLAEHMALQQKAIEQVVLINPLIGRSFSWSRLLKSAGMAYRDLLNPTGDSQLVLKKPTLVQGYWQNILKSPAGFLNGLISANNAQVQFGSASSAKVSLLYGLMDAMFFLDDAYLAELENRFAEVYALGKPMYGHIWPLLEPQEAAREIRTLVLNVRTNFAQTRSSKEPSAKKIPYGASLSTPSKKAP